MTTIPLHTSSSFTVPKNSTKNCLPTLLQTPSGLAILELQGTINLPDDDDADTFDTKGYARETPIGRLVFPHYEEGDETGKWMKKIYLYVGKHQRLTGEVKKLPQAMAVIRKRVNEEVLAKDGEEELEIVEIVKYKMLFTTRPEPVGAMV